MQQLDLNLLRLFDALATERSVTRAASRLNLTQSATSSALARLRRSLGDPLFVRTSSGLVTTPKAEAMTDTIRQCLTRIDEVTTRETPFTPGTINKQFRIRAPDHALRILLPYLIPALRKEAPYLSLEFQFLSSDDFFRELKVGELDILISYFSGKTGENLRATRIFTERVVTIASRNHSKIKRKLTLDNYIEAEHVVLRPQGTWNVSPIERALRKLGLARKVVMLAPSHLIVPMIVESSDIIATVPDNLARQFVKENAVYAYPMPFNAPSFEFSMAWHERAHRDPAHRWLRKLIAKFRDQQ
jgi:DNA-binding transcriptional LysR family regulator